MRKYKCTDNTNQKKATIAITTQHRFVQEAWLKIKRQRKATYIKNGQSTGRCNNFKFVCKSIASRYIKQNFITLKGEINTSTIKVEYFNIFLT